MPVSGRTTVENAVIAGFQAGIRIGRGDRQAELQKLAYGGRTRRHPVFEPEIVQRRQLFRGKHHLQSLIA